MRTTESYLTLRADKATHVLYHSNHWQVNFPTEIDFLANIKKRHLLYANQTTYQ